MEGAGLGNLWGRYNGALPYFCLNYRPQKLYNQNSTVNIPMKVQLKSAIKHTDTYLDTDIDESYSLPSFQTSSEARIKKRVRKKVFKNKAYDPLQYKLFRFRMRHLPRTLRIPCYPQEQLNLPIRFTKKLKDLVDNDVESDAELVEEEVDRCCGWLRAAVDARAGVSGGRL